MLGCGWRGSGPAAATAGGGGGDTKRSRGSLDEQLAKLKHFVGSSWRGICVEGSKVRVVGRVPSRSMIADCSSALPSWVVLKADPGRAPTSRAGTGDSCGRRCSRRRLGRLEVVHGEVLAARARSRESPHQGRVVHHVLCAVAKAIGRSNLRGVKREMRGGGLRAGIRASLAIARIVPGAICRRTGPQPTLDAPPTPGRG